MNGEFYELNEILFFVFPSGSENIGVNGKPFSDFTMAHASLRLNEPPAMPQVPACCKDTLASSQERW